MLNIQICRFAKESLKFKLIFLSSKLYCSSCLTVMAALNLSQKNDFFQHFEVLTLSLSNFAFSTGHTRFEVLRKNG